MAKPAAETFWQKLGLLLVTALLTGLLVPYITGRMAEDRAREDQKLAATLERQKSILGAQEQLLRELESTIFEFHTVSLGLPWYKAQHPDPTKFTKSWEVYDNAAWIFVAKMHALITRADRLTSQAVHKKLEAHQREWEALDVKLTSLHQEPSATSERWLEVFKELNAQASAATVVLHELALEYSLVPETAKRR